MPRGRYWTKQEIDTVKALVEVGLTHREIGDRLNRSHLSVRGLCTREGIKAPDKFTGIKKRRVQIYQFTDDEIKEIKDDFENSQMTTDEICEKYHFSKMVLYRLTQEHGFKPRKSGVPTWRRKLKVIDFSTLFRMYHEECETVDGIAKRLNVHRRVVYRSLDQHGLDRIPQYERKKIRDEFKDTGKTLKTWNEKLEAKR